MKKTFFLILLACVLISLSVLAQTSTPQEQSSSDGHVLQSIHPYELSSKAGK